ncbi:SusC/RagA family TonB-linked outer membrane protein [Flavisolibacter nicotianae]|uniref:SusC/RagA family TonB-linked outer membrane protein n=1 Tax=Flavisolibacter nicotianae TaxID=2364882 RepID=UPI0013C415B8|nr:TonB-dependent receptor [Flavisolibacter nicotianae]
MMAIVAIFLLASLQVTAQTRVSGKVTDEAQKPLQGVSVVVRGTSNGTTTDAGGNFSISVPGSNSVLVISYVGYTSQDITVGSNTTFNVSLAPSASANLNEVVVIGYGTASRRDLTGSITKVAGKEVADKPNTNPVASLQGKVPGLYIVNSGTPGQEPDIRIRGTVSIGQVHPLYVVDGILQDNINYINPTDIESIEILKDPSSLAIFGVRGATGAIAITTKKARAGQTVINFNTSYGFKQLVDKIKMANASEFATLFAEENANNNVATPDYSKFTSNTDWIDAVTRTGHFSNTGLNISTSTDKNRFGLGLGYIYDEGIIKHEQLSRMLLSLNDEVKLSNAVKIGVIFNTSRQHNPYDATWVLDAARKIQPQVSAEAKPFLVKNPYGSDSIMANLYSGLALQGSGVVNPLLVLENEWDKTISYENRYVGNVYTDIMFLKNFNFRPTWYADISTVEYRKYTPLYYAYAPSDNTAFLQNQRTSVYQSNQTWKKFQQDYILNYKKQFGAHNLGLTGGFTTYFFGTSQLYGTSSQQTGPSALPIPNNPRLWYLNNGFGIIAQNGAGSNQSEYTTVSYLARGLYNYKNKYYLNASFRDDASSRIPEKNRHQQFWSVGAAWELSKEDFMQSLSAINFLKLKGSTGVLGNQSTYGRSGDYPSYPGLQSGGTVVPFGMILASGALPEYRVNPDLRWETVNASEVGFELNAFRNRLHFEANYYTKKTKNMMTYVSLGSLGLDNQLENGGEIKNWGEELMATWNQNINRDFRITVGGNITFMKNKVVSVASSLPGGIIIDARANNGSAEARTMPGYPIGSFFGYVVEGIYQSQLDILKSPPASSLGSYRPGDFKFKDVNGDGVIDAKDRTIIGNPTPDFIYGGNIGLTYKRLNISADFGGVYGNEIFRVWGSLESPFQRVNYAAFKVDRWHGPGTSNWEPIISQGDRFNYNGSTYNIEDGSYFRIRNLQVGYDFNPGMLSKARIKNLRIYGNVQNLKTWKHNFGYTAEYGGSATAFGFDEAGGALPRVITFGLNATF